MGCGKTLMTLFILRLSLVLDFVQLHPPRQFQDVLQDLVILGFKKVNVCIYPQFSNSVKKRVADWLVLVEQLVEQRARIVDVAAECFVSLKCTLA